MCPILTLLTYYYFGYIDFERDEGIVYFRYLFYSLTPFL